MKKQYHNLESLRAERMRLELLCKEKEAQLAQRVEYIQENFGYLVLNSILPFSPEQKDSMGGIYDKVSRIIGKILPADSKLRQTLKPVLRMVQMFAAGIIYKYVKRFFGK